MKVISEVGFMEKGDLRKVAKIRNRGTILVINNKIFFKFVKDRGDIEIPFEEISNIILKNLFNLKIHLKNGDVYTLTCSIFLRGKNEKLFHSIQLLLEEYNKGE